MRRREIFSLTIGLLLLAVACEKKPPLEVVPNIPPETHLFIEGTVDTVGARQHLYWWGNDPDGYIKGFYLAVDDTSEKFWTERHDSTFVFESGSTVVIHRFYAWAVDNEDLADTSPAVLTLPVVNTPPTVQIVDQSVPRDTILPVLTLYFESHDIDGDETIEGYLYRTDLDGEDEWTELGPEADHVTLFDLVPGERTFYIMAWDNAGALSNVDSCLFVVGEVRGDFLLVDDETGDEGGSFYREVLDSLGIEYTVFKIEMGLPYSSFDVDYILNQMGFSCLLWYSGDSSHVSGAQGALATYLDNGGKLLLTSKAVLSHPLSDFAYFDCILRGGRRSRDHGDHVEPFGALQAFQSLGRIAHVVGSDGIVIGEAVPHPPVHELEIAGIGPGVLFLRQPGVESYGMIEIAGIARERICSRQVILGKENPVGIGRNGIFRPVYPESLKIPAVG